MGILVFTSCNGNHDQKGVMEAIQEVAPPIPMASQNDISKFKLRVAVHDYTAKQKIFVRDRIAEIDRFNCNSCHATPISPHTSQKKLTHADINLTHGSGDGPENCDICHAPDNRDKLKTVAGKQIEFSEVYQLCGDCHFRQKKDWVGGAHGKVVGGWDGVRIRYNCTDCHNPHSPVFPKRWPATYSLPDRAISSFSHLNKTNSSYRSNQGH